MNAGSTPSPLYQLLLWALRVIPALILLQTLYFKFSSSPESVYIFETVGMEPWGRYMTGTAELVAALLLLIPALDWLGALLAAGVMVGAIGSHLTVLGIEVMGDGGLLFGLALLVFFSSLLLLYLRRERNLLLRFLRERLL